MLSTKFNITFIPLWLENTMARTGMNFTDALNKEKLLSILSKNDIVFYLNANDLFTKIYLEELLRDNDMFTAPMNIELDKFNEDNNLAQEQIIALHSIYKDAPTPYTLEKSFLQHALGESIDMEHFENKRFGFIAQLIDDKNIVVRFKLLETEIPVYKFFGNFYEQLLRVVNYHFPFNDIAKTKLFAKYCSCVSLSVSK